MEWKQLPQAARITPALTGGVRHILANPGREAGGGLPHARTNYPRPNGRGSPC
jgi:hypothetical protein